MERLDVEVEPLDSMFGIDAARVPHPAEEFRERAAELRLAWAVAADWPPPINLLRAQRRRASKTTLARAAVAAGVVAGFAVGWRVEQSRWWKSTAPKPPARTAASAAPRERAASPAPAPRVTPPAAVAQSKPPIVTPPAVAQSKPAGVAPPTVGQDKPPVVTAPRQEPPRSVASLPPRAAPEVPSTTSTAGTATPTTQRPAPPVARAEPLRRQPAPSRTEAAARRPAPAPARAKPAPREVALPFDAVLGTILYSPDRKLAIIDGRIVGPGDEVRGARVTDITPTTVTLRDAQGRVRQLTLAAGAR
jgi:hypothetical protein